MISATVRMSLVSNWLRLRSVNEGPIIVVERLHIFSHIELKYDIKYDTGASCLIGHYVLVVTEADLQTSAV